jgi:RimJ/RimL family protein N-acetyltransferase
MSLTEVGLAGRTVLISDGDLALAEMLDGERERVEAQLDKAFYPDPDDRPVPFQVTRHWAAVLNAVTGELVGMMSWRPVPHLTSVAGMAWNIGIDLVPGVRGRGRGGNAGLLLARYLFATTGADRVQAMVEAANVPGWRSLEKSGFTREGVVRGILKRGGRRHDMVSYSLLRSDLETTDGERVVLGRRAGVVLARAWPEDHARVAAVDPDHRLPPVAAVPALTRASVLDEESGALLGEVTWHAVDYGTLGCAAWTIGIMLIPEARGRGVGTVAQRLLAEHLFASTELDRVEAVTDVDNAAERRALEKAGFRFDGMIRGGGRRRDLVLYGMVRADLTGSGGFDRGSSG